MKILKPYERKTGNRYHHNYDYVGHIGWGFSFTCDEKGNVDRSKLTPAGLSNLDDCEQGKNNTIDRGVQHETWSYNEYAVGQCDDCFREVELYSNTNVCDCGAIYNMSGQHLAPVSQWEPEDVYDSFGPQNRPDDW